MGLYLEMPTTSDNMAEKAGFKTLWASFPPGTLTKMPLRSNTWTVFAFWLTAGSRAKGFSQR